MRTRALILAAIIAVVLLACVPVAESRPTCQPWPKCRNVTTTTTTRPPVTTTTVAPTTTTKPPVTTTTTQPPVTTTTVPPGGSVHLRAIDGGTNFYPANSFPNDPAFFPLGVWFESVTSSSDTAKDQAAGLNTYVVLTNNSSAALIRAAGMHTMPAEYDRYASEGTELKSWMLGDELDMILGPGAGYTEMQNRANNTPNDGRPRYANYGKGVLFWEADSEARQFVNNYQTIVSADGYFYSDNNICGQWEGGKIVNNDHQLSTDECIRASNYGWEVARLRGFQPGVLLTTKARPVWGFVEVGPQGNRHTPTGPEISAAVWSMIINGARGIIYFNHAFAGPCNGSQHFLRDCDAAVRTAVTNTNAQVKALAPVLNAPFADGYVSAPGVETMAKWSGGQYYVFAGNHDNAAKTTTYSLACTGNGTATVLNESRSIPIVGGHFSDAFANGTAVHNYRIDGGTTCSPG